MIRNYMIFAVALLTVVQSNARLVTHQVGLSQDEIRLDTTGNTVGIEANEICHLVGYSRVYCNKLHANLDNASVHLESLGTQEVSKRGYIGKYAGDGKRGSGFRVYLD